MDFTAASSTITVTEDETVILTITHADDIVNRVLQMQTHSHGKYCSCGISLLTSQKRIDNWNAKGFVGNIPPSQIVVRRTSSRVKRYVMVKDITVDLTVDAPHDNYYFFTGCQNVRINCANKTTLHIDNCNSMTVHGASSANIEDINIYNSEVHFESPGKGIFLTYHSDDEIFWLPKVNNPGITGLQEISPIVEAGRNKQYYCSYMPAYPVFLPVFRNEYDIHVTFETTAISTYLNQGPSKLWSGSLVDGGNTLIGDTDAWCWKSPDYKGLVSFTEQQLIVWGLEFLTSRNYSKFACMHILNTHLKPKHEWYSRWHSRYGQKDHLTAALTRKFSTWYSENEKDAQQLFDVTEYNDSLYHVNSFDLQTDRARHIVKFREAMCICASHWEVPENIVRHMIQLIELLKIE
jgi:hypothetical protein